MKSSWTFQIFPERSIFQPSKIVCLPIIHKAVNKIIGKFHCLFQTVCTRKNLVCGENKWGLFTQNITSHCPFLKRLRFVAGASWFRAVARYSGLVRISQLRASLWSVSPWTLRKNPVSLPLALVIIFFQLSPRIHDRRGGSEQRSIYKLKASRFSKLRFCAQIAINLKQKSVCFINPCPLFRLPSLVNTAP